MRSSPLLPLRFGARVVRGKGRGRGLGSPTLNLRLADVPPSLPEGIFACGVRIGAWRGTGAMHLGPRPVFHAGRSCEVHVIDRVITRPPAKIALVVLVRLRSIRNFPSIAALQRQIARDIAHAKRIATKSMK